MSEILESLKWHRIHVLTGPGRELSNSFVKVYDYAVGLEDRLARVERLLLDLTPGGSEFHGSPERCAEWIQERLATMGKLAAERNAYRAKAERLAIDREIVE